MTLQGKVVVQPLVGTDRDEITALVARLKKADERTQHTHAPAVKQADLEWAEDLQLPREVFDYFELDRVA